MRVTNYMGTIQVQLDLSKNREKVFQLQQEASSGKRIHQASDDPAASSRLVKLNTEQKAAAQYQHNIKRSIGQLDTADNALDQMAEVLRGAHETAIAMANGSVSPTQRAQMAAQVQGYRDSLVKLANTQYGDTYIFGGYLTGQAPFSNVGVYSGDTNQKQIEVGDGVFADVGVNGSEAFTAAGGVDIFTALSDLSTALTTNDATNIQASIATLSSSHDQVVGARGKIGRQTADLMQREQVLTDSVFNYQTEVARLSEADPLITYSSLVEAQNALSTSLTVAGRLLSSLSLVDKL